MKQLTIISGKGGTGKTSLTAAFASLADAVLADCDVDASDLHLILKPDVKKREIFHGMELASVDKSKCIDCKKCYESCRFGAIDEDINIIRESCEGCGVCEYVCPTDAIKMVERDSGYSYISETRFGPMSHAMLMTAEEASGELVAVVRENAKKLAEEHGKELIIIDGPPGIGCPVISSITGVDLVLIVTEPTLSAIHDLERILEVANHFDVPAVVCINKYDINEEKTADIEKYCDDRGITIVGKLPYDTVFTDAMIQEKSVVEFSDDKISEEIKAMWNKIKDMLSLTQ